MRDRVHYERMFGNGEIDVTIGAQLVAKAVYAVAASVDALREIIRDLIARYGRDTLTAERHGQN